MCSREVEKKACDFKLGTFIARFPTDDVASMAVKGLIYSWILTSQS